MTAIFSSPRPQFEDANGEPYSGGKLYFFDAGTSTPRNVFSDAALTVPITQPVILDASGMAPTIFMSPALYRVRLDRADDSLVFDEPQYDPGAAVGGGIVQIANGGTGATTAAAARANLGLNALAGATLPSDRGSIPYLGTSAWSAFPPGLPGQSLRIASTTATDGLPVWRHQSQQTQSIVSGTLGTITLTSDTDFVLITGTSASTLAGASPVSQGRRLIIGNFSTQNLTISNGSGANEFFFASGVANVVVQPNQVVDFVGTSTFWCPTQRGNVAPFPISGSGIGQFAPIAATSTYALPAGGNWAYFFNTYTSGGLLNTGGNAGIAAGGTTLFSSAGILIGGFAFRIN